MHRKIQNSQQLAENEMRKDALAMAEAALQAIDTTKATQHLVSASDGTLSIKDQSYDLSQYEHIYVVGVGKCSLEAAIAIEQIMGEYITEGIVVDVRSDNGSLNTIRAYAGTHPFPSDENISYTHKILNLLEKTEENDLVLFIVSGGGSTLLCQPDTNVCTDEVEVVKCLYQVGASIQDINTVRKHLSKARGGNLAKYAYPAQSVALIYSDVPDNDFSYIASGPTVKDESTVDDAVAVLNRFSVQDACGFDVCPHLLETPKEDYYFARVTNILAVSNSTALDAMQAEASNRGYDARICSTCLSGEARHVAGSIVSLLHRENVSSALFYGGETTVTITGSGSGGRNRELALAAISDLRDDELVLTLASDGRDNGDQAGAIVDSLTKKKMQERDVDPVAMLADNNSHDFFEAVGDSVMTGYTGSNVSDLLIALKGKHHNE